MHISKDTVVEFHYTVFDGDNQLESSKGGEPLAYLHGHNGWLPKLEQALEGQAEGANLVVELKADDAYGKRHDNAMQRIPLKHLQGAKVWKPGMTAVVNTDQGQHQVTVVKVGRFNADCDLNHPFAGKDLKFDIDVVSIRAATSDEIAHGHVHGAGGCGH